MSKTNKTQATAVDVDTFLDQVTPEKRSLEGKKLNEIFKEATGEGPVLWGPNIVGYGQYHYKYKSGREGDFMRVGFSPRRAKLSIYIMGDHGRYQELFDQLGKYTTGKSCLYINKLEDVDTTVLKNLIKASYDYIGNKQWP